MKRPTDQEWQEVLEWYGFEFVPKKEDMLFGSPQEYWAVYDHWIYSDGSKHRELPPSDLKSLFLYAVPTWVTGIEFSWGDEAHTTTICRIWHGVYGGLGQYRAQLRQDFYEAEGETEFLALFWAIKQAIESMK